MTKHTPGPWWVEAVPHERYPDLHENLIMATYEGNKAVVATVDNADDDARLIAAAPELLEALRFAILTIEHRDGLRHRLDLFTETERARLHAAIAKAEGR